MEQSFDVAFEGYWREEHKSDLPDKAGIYCVYECTYRPSTMLFPETFEIQRLLYIGISDNVRERHQQKHEKHEEWLRIIQPRNQLCYSFGRVKNETYLERIEAALINHHQPPSNTEYKNAFPFDPTHIRLSGDIQKLIRTFTVNRH